MSTPEKRKRTVEWDEANLAKNFAERSATMKIDEIETPWHSPPRELFHDLSVEDEGRAPREDVAERERRHAEVMAKLHEVIRADVRGRSCLLYTSPSPRDKRQSRMPSSA